MTNLVILMVHPAQYSVFDRRTNYPGNTHEPNPFLCSIPRVLCIRDIRNCVLDINSSHYKFMGVYWILDICLTDISLTDISSCYKVTYTFGGRLLSLKYADVWNSAKALRNSLRLITGNVSFSLQIIYLKN